MLIQEVDKVGNVQSVDGTCAIDVGGGQWNRGSAVLIEIVDQKGYIQSIYSAIGGGIPADKHHIVYSDMAFLELGEYGIGHRIGKGRS